MFRHISLITLLTFFCCSAYAVVQKHGIIVGEILQLDAMAKTVVVKLADGTKHTLHFAEHTVVHGSRATAAGAEASFRGLKEGGEVAVHYTLKGTEETAQEVDSIGKDGLKATDATVIHIDRGGKKLAVKTADGSEETFRLTDNAAKDVGKGTEKATKVTIYYSEEAGHKIAHFFKRAI